MFIRTETTPNPNSLKFIPGVPVLEGEPLSFTNATDTNPIAKILFMHNFVKQVFIGSDFVTVTKDEEYDWNLIKPDILMSLMDYFVADHQTIENNQDKTDYTEQSDIVNQIKELIETRVRPAVAQDGGDIIFKSFKDGIVYLELHGSCSGCPSSTITLKNGIESMLKHYVPEVEAVESI